MNPADAMAAALQAPCRPQAGRGLPSGVQLLMPWGGEARLPNAARRIEDAIGMMASPC